MSQCNTPISNTAVNKGAIEDRPARVNTSEVQHQTLLNTPGLLSKRPFSSGDNDDGIALQPSLSSPVFTMAGQSQAATGCEAHACFAQVAALVLWDSVTDRQLFMAAMLNGRVGVTCYAQPNFYGAHIPIPTNLHLQDWA